MNLMKWTKWMDPNTVQQSEIAPAAGIYELLSVDIEDRPLQFNSVTPIALGVNQDDIIGLQGVLYIGKADDLRDRYWKFVQSWQTGSSVDGHGCRTKKYEPDAKIQRDFPLSCLRVRHMPIVEHSQSDDHAEQVRKALIPYDVQRRTRNVELIANPGMSPNPRNDYASYVEGEHLRLFVKCFGSLPILNKTKGETESPKPSDAFLKALFGDSWIEDE